MPEGASPGASERGDPRVLRRSRDGRVVGGVCAGLGRYLGIDPVLLRIAFVVLAIAGGGGLLLYGVAWILIPEEREGEPLGTERPPSAETTRLIVGGSFVALGTILLLDLSIPSLARFFWPLALIAVGVAVVVQASMPRR
jgi:phage shock protein C